MLFFGASICLFMLQAQNKIESYPTLPILRADNGSAENIWVEAANNKLNEYKSYKPAINLKNAPGIALDGSPTASLEQIKEWIKEGF